MTVAVKQKPTAPRSFSVFTIRAQFVRAIIIAANFKITLGGVAINYFYQHKPVFTVSRDTGQQFTYRFHQQWDQVSQKIG
jgi:hypothetical protein